MDPITITTLLGTAEVVSVHGLATIVTLFWVVKLGISEYYDMVDKVHKVRVHHDRAGGRK